MGLRPLHDSGTTGPPENAVDCLRPAAPRPSAASATSFAQIDEQQPRVGWTMPPRPVSPRCRSHRRSASALPRPNRRGSDLAVPRRRFRHSRASRGDSNSGTVMPNASATLTSTARDGFAVPDSILRTCAGSTPIRSAAASMVHSRAVRKCRTRRASSVTAHRNRGVCRWWSVFVDDVRRLTKPRAYPRSVLPPDGRVRPRRIRPRHGRVHQRRQRPAS